MKTLQFKSNVHLSPKFGGIEHGEKLGPDIKLGATHEIQSDELAAHLIERGLADEIKVEREAKPKKEKTETAGGSAKLAILLIIGLFASLAMSAHADLFSYKTVQFTNAISGVLSTNGQVILTAGQVLTVNSDPIPIAAKRGLSLWNFLQCSGAATGNTTNTFDVATVYNSSTNWTTTHPISVITTANGTTLVVNWTNLPAATLDNVTLIRWATCANGAVQSTNYVQASWSTYAP